MGDKEYITQTQAILLLDITKNESLEQFQQANIDNGLEIDKKIKKAEKDFEENFQNKLKEKKKEVIYYLKKVFKYFIYVNIIGIVISLIMAYNCRGVNLKHMLVACCFWVFYIPYRLIGDCTKKKNN